MTLLGHLSPFRKNNAAERLANLETQISANNVALLAKERVHFHQDLLERHILSLSYKSVAKTNQLVASNADVSQATSRNLAMGVFERIAPDLPHIPKALDGQTSGKLFEVAVSDYIANTFPKLQFLRPGTWTIAQLGNQSNIKASSFTQYSHISSLDAFIKDSPELRSVLGNDYVVAPDIVIGRNRYTDAQLNSEFTVVDNETALEADLRMGQTAESQKPILHASISAKWTIRSDRAQNSRTEALNLIRNRKGHLPHIMVVTGEPSPTRLASLALGTGDIDCVYHAFLYELFSAVEDYAQDGHEDLLELMRTLVDGKRLKDISDLPLDLAD
ncbi:hypothetical protein BAAM0499_07845 [Bifidobacterium animalis subsp. animalis MCC 0499]|uniref:NgoMIV family type II restriction endonuclease n=1 Tax=Bifidobacterium animalis TaxID=28025 RepID=UPI0006A478BD|nr:NgoMIV family type II restriction endonuclease [Bifidobacterium animalis]KOA59059.1 hypothetical protein BAAM0499_07845 [Bifidobacterium animalis subsp. animalis MCC 0499]